MRPFLTIYFLLICFSTSAQIKTPNIFGKIKNLKSDSLMIASYPVSNDDLVKVDTVISKNGNFEYTSRDNELYQVNVIPFDLIHRYKNGRVSTLPSSRIKFFLNVGEVIHIDAKIEGKIAEYETKGNRLSEQFANSLKNKKEAFTSRYLFESQYNEKKKSENSPDDEKIFMANIGANNLAYQNASLSYVKTHLNEEVSPLLLLEVSNKDTVITLYKQLGPAALDSYYGKKLTEIVKGWYSTQLGQKLSPLNARTIDGQSFIIGSPTNKYTLLDFWGTWCAPCMAEMPELKKFNEKYKDKIQLIGLICNDTKEKVVATIKSKGLNWLHLYSETDEFGPLFGIRSYPTKILLDPDGIVIKIYIGVNDTIMDEIAGLIQKNK